MLTRLREVVRAVATRALGLARTVTRPRRLPVALVDLARTRRELIAENALLRHQLVVLERGTKRPRLTGLDRWLLLGLAHSLMVRPRPRAPVFRRYWLRICPSVLDLRFGRDGRPGSPARANA